MNMRILVPLDGSSRAEAALPVALDLANKLQADLLLFRVAQIQPPHFDSVEYEIKIMSEANHYLNEVRATLTNPALGPAIELERVRVAVAYGPTVRRLTELDPFEQANLIVMTTHARTGLSRLVLGSVATEVVHQAGVPVVLVQPGKDGLDLRLPERLKELQSQPQLQEPFSAANFQPCVLISLDGTLEAERALPSAAELAVQLKAPLHLLRVVEPEATVEYGFLNGIDIAAVENRRVEEAISYLAEIQTRLARPGLNCSKAVRKGQAALQISSYAANIHATLLAMTTHARKRVSNIVQGCVAEEVLRETHLPVLMVYSGN